MELEQQLRESYAERLRSLDVPGGDVAAARRTGARMRAKRRLAAGTAVAVVLALAVGGTVLGARHDVGPSHATGHWRELPPAPLSPRADALAVWTGKEVVVVGGEGDPCPPNVDGCFGSGRLRDGAAYDPTTNAWHPIERAPLPVGPGDRLLSAAGRVILRYAEPHGSRLFVYDPGTNEWFEIPSFFADLPSAFGGDVYGFHRARVVMYDAARGLWHERIPRDPIQPRLVGRRVTATSLGPVVTGIDVDSLSTFLPAHVFADVWNGSRWRRLPVTGQLGNNEWFWTGTQLVDPEPGEDGSWVFPMGGRLDPVTGRWSPLPSTLTEEVGDGWAGIDAAGGRWVATYGKVYDTATGRVSTLPRPAGAPAYDVAAAWAGDSLVAFGGSDRQSSDLSGGTTNRAWLWTP